MSFSEEGYSGNSSGDSSFWQQVGGQPDKYALSNAAERAIGIMYWFVFVIGTLGNLLVLVVLVTPQGRRAAGGHHATSRVFLMSLASADLLLHLISSWVEAVNLTLYLDEGWKFGNGFCKINSVARVLACNVSVFTLSAIAIDRYLVISRHGKQIITWKRALVICILLWVFNLLMAIPWLSWAAVLGPPGFMVCSFDRTVNDDLLSGLSIGSRIVQYFLPLLVTWLAYGGIIYIMYSSSKKVSSETSSSSNKSTWRVARMCLLVVLCFTLTWTPFQVAVLYISHLTLDDPKFTLARSLMIVSLFLSSVNSCINPIVYATLWRPFKQALWQILRINKASEQNASINDSTTRANNVGQSE